MVSVHSSDPHYSDNSVAQQVNVSPAAEQPSWAGSALVEQGTTANLSATVAPPFGETQFYDFNDHPVWVRFDITNGSGKTSTSYAKVARVNTPSGYFGQGTASVKGAALAPGAYRVRARLVARSGSATPNVGFHASRWWLRAVRGPTARWHHPGHGWKGMTPHDGGAG